MDLMKVMKRILSIFILIFLLAAMLPVISGCQKTGESDYLIAYTNSTNDDVEYFGYSLPNKDSMTKEDIVNDLITHLLIDAPEDGIHYSPLPSAVSLNSFLLKDGMLTMDFDEEYQNLTNVQEIILKACVVLTLVQVDEVEEILFTINGQPITDSEGEEIGAMDPTQYVDLMLSDEELLKQDTSVQIYFTEDTGRILVPFDYQFTIDNQTQSLEEYMIRKLIEGPDEEGAFPTLDPSLELISIMTTDYTCYVNFGSGFLEQSLPVSDEIMLYSIVNSLTGLPYINSVQILVDGESDVLLHKTIDLSKPLFTRYDLISE